jgi:hypothetical protein
LRRLLGGRDLGLRRALEVRGVEQLRVAVDAVVDPDVVDLDRDGPDGAADAVADARELGGVARAVAAEAGAGVLAGEAGD